MGTMLFEGETDAQSRTMSSTMFKITIDQTSTWGKVRRCPKEVPLTGRDEPLPRYPILPPGWCSAKDPATGRDYYCNTDSGVTTWEYYYRDPMGGLMIFPYLLTMRLNTGDDLTFKVSENSA